MATKVQIERENLLKPLKTKDQKKGKVEEMELSAFDRATYDTNFSIIFFFRAPTFCNSAMEKGLIRALEEYPEWAGQVARNSSPSSSPSSILLDNRGVYFVEATCNTSLNSFIPSTPNPNLLYLHGARSKEEEEEPLLHIQITRFSCGGLSVGITASHVIADGIAACSFWIKWGNCTRGIVQLPRQILDRKILPPRNPLKIEFEHKGVEYDVLSHPSINGDLRKTADIIMEKVNFSAGFLRKLKSLASSPLKSYTTFEVLVAHLWRSVTKARGLDNNTETRIRIAVDGRRRLKPTIPEGYLGNLVLWAFPAADTATLRHQPLSHAAELIRAAVAKLDESYFRSFVDFSELVKRKEIGEELYSTAEMDKRVLSPNLEVDCWLRFPFYGVDFGSGPPDLFTPTWMPYEGNIALLPSPAGHSGVDVLVALFRDNMSLFKNICYALDETEESMEL